MHELKSACEPEAGQEGAGRKVREVLAEREVDGDSGELVNCW